jgi:valyl-tRNA synthetase
MAGFQFAEVTRTLYDAVWTEYCDWGLELAKTRLGDESLPAETREATWWTLVEALDTYLRLLHPVMPFLTEALWASLPHAPEDPDLLIVAAWPAPGALDPFADMAVASLIELVHGTRNARAEAGLDAAAWLPMDVAGPAPLITAFEDLRAALERLGRARPLQLHGNRDALVAIGGPGTLTVIVGDVEARITPAADPEAADRDRGRLEKELAEAQGFLAAARARLANEAFVAKAPPAVVEGARAREAELADTVARLGALLDR